MDIQNDTLTADCSSLQQLAGHRIVVGAKQLRKALSQGRATRVFLASNADPAITEPIAALCQQNEVPFAWVKSMTDLGRACGIEVGAAAAAAVD